MNKQVHVCRYVTEATFDAYLWQTIENKQKFISQIMTSKSPVRSCEDVDEAALSYAEIKALCAGDPRIKERMELDVEVNKLKIMKASHQSQQYRLQDRLIKYFPEQIKKCQNLLADLKRDEHIINDQKYLENDFPGMEIGNQVYCKRSDAGAALLAAAKNIPPVGQVCIGKYRGLEMYLLYDNFRRSIMLRFKGSNNYDIDIRRDAVGNIIRADNVLRQIPDRINNLNNKLSELYRERKADIGKPFELEAELSQKNARMIELDMELNIDRFEMNIIESSVLAS